jgi:hypothetical protein
MGEMEVATRDSSLRQPSDKVPFTTLAQRAVAVIGEVAGPGANLVERRDNIPALTQSQDSSNWTSFLGYMSQLMGLINDVPPGCAAGVIAIALRVRVQVGNAGLLADTLAAIDNTCRNAPQSISAEILASLREAIPRLPPDICQGLVEAVGTLWGTMQDQSLEERVFSVVLQ